MNTLPLRLSQASGVPFYRQVVDQLSELIRSGELVSGQRLPSVRELARELLVSLITVRRAYAELEAAGLIVRRQGQGSFVAEHVQSVASERGLAEARELLAQAVTEALQRGLDPAAITDLVHHTLEEHDA